MHVAAMGGGMQGDVHGLSCVVGFTVRLGQLGLARSRSGVCVCVCSRGGMAGCLAAPWCVYLHIQLRAGHEWVLVGGRVMFSIRLVPFWPVGDRSGPRWVKDASRVGQEWDKSGSRLGQYWVSWIMRASSGGSRAVQELAPSWSIVGPGTGRGLCPGPSLASPLAHP